MASRVMPLLRAHWGLLALLGAGFALRVALIAAYSPAIMNNPDTWGYVKGAEEDLFIPDVRRPAGYALFLRALHAISSELEFAIVAQHLLGLLAVVLVYAITLRADFGRGAALVPAATAALAIDLLYLEHALLSETLFMVILLGASLFLQIAMERTADARWRARTSAYATAGILLGTAVTVRTSAVFLIVPLVLFVAILPHPRLTRRLANAGALALPTFMVVLVYMLAQQGVTGHLGLNPGGGWMLYARAAPFADCRYFAEPKGTTKLCETSPPAARPGGDFYAWDPRSPARNIGIAPLDADPILTSWSRAAILREPKAYVINVLSDLWRYVDPYPERRTLNGGTPDVLAIDGRWDRGEALNRSVIDPYYSGDNAIHTSGLLHTLAVWQRILRFHGPLMLTSLLLVLSGLAFARGQALRTMLLLALVGFVIPVFTVVTVMWGWRYAVPLQPAMAGAGAIGAVTTFRGLSQAFSRPRRRSAGAVSAPQTTEVATTSTR